MSEETKTKSQTNQGGMGGGPMGRGGWGAMGRPVEKAKDFKGTLRRLLRYFLPEKVLLSVVFVAAIFGTIFNIVGPKILGLATTKLFNNLMTSFVVQVKNQVIKKELLQKRRCDAVKTVRNRLLFPFQPFH